MPYSGINFSLRLHSKFWSDSDFVVFEPISHPSVDILSVMAMKGSDLPITIVNHSDRTVTLSGGFVLGVVSDVVNSNVATPDFRRPEFEIRTLYADEFRDCYPAVKSDNFLKIKQTLPEHLQDLFERSCTNITLYQSVKLANLLSEFAFIFSKSDTDLGHFKAVYHRIVTRNDEPIKSRMRRTPLHFEKEEEASLKKMLDAGVIVESNSEYAHPVCLVRKKDGSVRWCIDMRKLNFYTVKDCFPIPRIEQCLDTLCGNRYFSTLDLLSGYWQIAIHPEDRKKKLSWQSTVFLSIKWCALACVTLQPRFSVQCSTFWAVFYGRKLSVTWMTLFRWVRTLSLHSVIFGKFLIDFGSIIWKWNQRSVSYFRSRLNILVAWWVTKESPWDLNMFRLSGIGLFRPPNRSFNRTWDLRITIVNTLKIMLS